MAYMFLPAAFVYLLPAAIFFWLSKDVLSVIGKKASGLAAGLFKSGEIKAKKITKREDQSESNDKADVVELSDTPSEVPVDEEEPIQQEKDEVELAKESPDGQMTIEDAIVEDEPDESVAEPMAEEALEEEAIEETLEDESVEETLEDESVEEAIDAPVDESTKGDENTEEEAAPDVAAADIDQDDTTIAEAAADEAPEESKQSLEAAAVITSVKNTFNTVTDKAKNLVPSKETLSSVVGKAKSLIPEKKPKERLEEKPVEEILEIDADERTEEKSFNQVTGWAKLKSNLDSGDVVEDIKRQFDNLDMITTSAIAIMLSDTKTKAASPYIKSLKKPDVRVILLKFCQDSYFATDIEQLNDLFSKSYYKWKITRYLGRLTTFIKRGIGDSLPKRIAFRKARITKNRFINKICETINTFESVKYISALSGNEEISDSKRNYKLDHLSENYKDALIYLVDLLLTCTCIAKMLFVERMIKNMDENSEFSKIITNMAQSIDNHNLIISKSRPIYKQYYQAELGYINGDDLLYGMAITIMVNRVKKVAIKNTDILQINTDLKNTRDFKQSMQKWLDELAKVDAVGDIGTLILQKITLSISGNYGLLTNALQDLTTWENYYSQRVAYYKKERDKERYLKGDFELEKEELIKIR